jgi:acetyl esterase/lipase
VYRFLLAGLFVLTAASYGDEPRSREAQPDEPRIPLWNGRAPIGGGKFEEAEAWITVHRPDKSNGAAIVICPGGGYGGLVTGPEGHGIAAWLNRHGVTGVVLEYRLPAGRPFVPLLDAQRAIRTVRARADEWGVDPSRIGMMGFSAGGHLASTAGTHFDDGDVNAGDAVERVGCRPDFLILVYPVITLAEKTHQGTKTNLLGPEPSPELVGLFSNERQVSARTPPTFLAHAQDDEPVPPINSQAFYAALQVHKIASEYLELPSGGHGLNGYQGPMWDAWQEKSLAWLARLKFMPAETAARPDEPGFVSLFDGKTLEGWTVNCLPQDRELAATAWTVDQGTILADSMGHTGHFYILLATNEEYDDFVLRLRIQVERGVTGNSGIQIRSRYNAESGWMEGPQIDINPPSPELTGKLWNEGPGVHRWLSNEPIEGVKFFYAYQGAGWNDLEITAEGTRIKSVLNGVTVVDYDGAGVLDDELHKQRNVGTKGVIGLQLHSYDQLKLRFTDIRIKRL